MNDATEKFLEAQGIAFTTEVISIDKIDPGSFKRQVRQEEVITDLRDSYALAMLDGDEFPRVIVRRTNGGLFYVLDGIHRTAAAGEIGNPTIDACVVDVDPEEGRLISLLANRIHGERTTVQEAVHHAIELHRNHGMSISRASKLMRVSSSSVGNILRRQEGSKRAADLGVRAYDYFPNATQDALVTIKQDGPFTECIRAVHAKKLSASDVVVMVRKVRAARSEPESIAIARQFEPTKQARKAKASRPDSPRQRVRSSCTSLSSIDEASFKADLAGLTSDERGELSERCRKTATRLMMFADVAAS